MSDRKERTRALFKKGQKCLVAETTFGDDGSDVIVFLPAMVRC